MELRHHRRRTTATKRNARAFHGNECALSEVFQVFGAVVGKSSKAVTCMIGTRVVCAGRFLPQPARPALAVTGSVFQDKGVYQEPLLWRSSPNRATGSDRRSHGGEVRDPSATGVTGPVFQDKGVYQEPSMPISYPLHSPGRYQLGLGFTYKLLHDRFGFDFGERYHRDLDYRIETTMEIDRAAFEGDGQLRPGRSLPGSHRAVRPSLHARHVRLPCGFAEDADPLGAGRWCSRKPQIRRPWNSWTPARFEASRAGADWCFRRSPAKGTLRTLPRGRRGSVQFPHYRAMSSLQNLGSVINTAFSVQGQTNSFWII